jgi:hypothetical protein
MSEYLSTQPPSDIVNQVEAFVSNDLGGEMTKCYGLEDILPGDAVEIVAHTEIEVLANDERVFVRRAHAHAKIDDIRATPVLLGQRAQAVSIWAVPGKDRETVALIRTSGRLRMSENSPVINFGGTTFIILTGWNEDQLKWAWALGSVPDRNIQASFCAFTPGKILTNLMKRVDPGQTSFKMGAMAVTSPSEWNLFSVPLNLYTGTAATGELLSKISTQSNRSTTNTGSSAYGPPGVSDDSTSSTRRANGRVGGGQAALNQRPIGGQAALNQRLSPTPSRINRINSSYAAAINAGVNHNSGNGGDSSASSSASVRGEPVGGATQIRPGTFILPFSVRTGRFFPRLNVWSPSRSAPKIIEITQGQIALVSTGTLENIGSVLGYPLRSTVSVNDARPVTVVDISGSGDVKSGINSNGSIALGRSVGRPAAASRGAQGVGVFESLRRDDATAEGRAAIMERRAAAASGPPLSMRPTLAALLAQRRADVRSRELGLNNSSAGDLRPSNFSVSTEEVFNSIVAEAAPPVQMKSSSAKKTPTKASSLKKTPTKASSLKKTPTKASSAKKTPTKVMVKQQILAKKTKSVLAARARSVTADGAGFEVGGSVVPFCTAPALASGRVRTEGDQCSLSGIKFESRIATESEGEMGVDPSDGEFIIDEPVEGEIDEEESIIVPIEETDRQLALFSLIKARREVGRVRETLFVQVLRTTTWTWATVCPVILDTALDNSEIIQLHIDEFNALHVFMNTTRDMQNRMITTKINIPDSGQNIFPRVRVVQTSPHILGASLPSIEGKYWRLSSQVNVRGVDLLVMTPLSINPVLSAQEGAVQKNILVALAGTEIVWARRVSTPVPNGMTPDSTPRPQLTVLSNGMVSISFFVSNAPFSAGDGGVARPWIQFGRIAALDIVLRSLGEKEVIEQTPGISSTFSVVTFNPLNGKRYWTLSFSGVAVSPALTPIEYTSTGVQVPPAPSVRILPNMMVVGQYTGISGLIVYNKGRAEASIPPPFSTPGSRMASEGAYVQSNEVLLSTGIFIVTIKQVFNPLMGVVERRAKNLADLENTAVFRPGDTMNVYWPVSRAPYGMAAPGKVCVVNALGETSLITREQYTKSESTHVLGVSFSPNWLHVFPVPPLNN